MKNFSKQVMNISKIVKFNFSHCDKQPIQKANKNGNFK